jgi:hypothetical protein
MQKNDLMIRVKLLFFMLHINTYFEQLDVTIKHCRFSLIPNKRCFAIRSFFFTMFLIFSIGKLSEVY